MDLRELIFLIEQAGMEEGTVVVPTDDEPELFEEVNVAERLTDLVFKMRSYQEPLMESTVDSVQSAYCDGVEVGLGMAAEMLENLLREMGESN